MNTAGAQTPSARMQHRRFLLVCAARDFRPRDHDGGLLHERKAGVEDAALCARLWNEVGRGFWIERSRWDEARWRRHLARPEIDFRIGRRDHRDIGCFELVFGKRGARLEGFGLLPDARGTGLGGAWLTTAMRMAFAAGARELRLATATDDHPHALPNYLARGFRVVRETALADPMPSLNDHVRSRQT